MHFNVEPTDFVTIGLLVLLEAALSADNALVLAVLVLPLPVQQQKRALRYGIFGAVGFRIVATLFAVYIIHWEWVKLVGAAYLLYLPAKHFWLHPDESKRGAPRAIATILGLTAFWSTVVRVELTDIVFAIDSILVAIAMSRKVWVIAYVIVAWVGVKLLIEFLHGIHVIGWEIPRWLSITVMLLFFGASAVYAKRAKPGVKHSAGKAQDLVE